MAIEMKLKGLMVDPVTEMPIVVLKDASGDAVLPIWVGLFEANAIAMQLEHIVPPRPMTHDLLRDLVLGLGARVDRVVIADLKENTFYARIHLTRDDEGPVIDARPSDAIALALRTNARILVEEEVLRKSTQSDGEDDRAVADEAERLRKWLESAGPDELGRYEM